jgi:kynurenine formamidase
MKRIDLSHLLNEKISVYPDTVPPLFEISNTVEKDEIYREKNNPGFSYRNPYLLHLVI